MTSREMNEARIQLHETKSHLDYLLEVFGDALAKTKGYKDLDGMEAICFYLCEKHHWTPATVRAMNTDDLRLLLSQEMAGWTAPKEAVFKK